MIPVVNNRGIHIKYKAVETSGVEFSKHEYLYNIDTILVNEEHTVIAYDNNIYRKKLQLSFGKTVTSDITMHGANPKGILFPAQP